MPNVPFSKLPNTLATDGDLTDFLTEVTEGDLPDIPVDKLPDIPLVNLPDLLTTEGDLASFISNDGLFLELTPLIGSVNAFLGTGVNYFDFFC